MMENQWERTALMLGEEALETLHQKKVAIFGIGGVGSWCAEALCRAGIGTLALFDHDCVSLTNLNRQIIALHSTVGQPKAAVMAARLRDINPAINIEEHQVFYSAENALQYDLTQYDCIVDAIDTVTSKLVLIENATAAGVPIISSMGTGNKLSPSCLVATDLAETDTCPLARVMRRELRRRNIEHLRVVYSTEAPLTPEKRVTTTSGNSHPKDVPGSISFVPSSAGLLIASEVVKGFLGIGSL